MPEDSYFFLGDNRANSKDARYWEQPFIDEDNIMGKARIVISPFSRFGKLK
ncbi:S26 family signal peptidase [Clostridium sp.]|uniref:S26 family signal peptidase n=1 Tax=Clostridium sp. TaxID=1506 RepID=UPI003F4BFB34